MLKEDKGDIGKTSEEAIVVNQIRDDSGLDHSWNEKLVSSRIYLGKTDLSGFPDGFDEEVRETDAFSHIETYEARLARICLSSHCHI